MLISITKKRLYPSKQMRMETCSSTYSEVVSDVLAIVKKVCVTCPCCEARLRSLPAKLEEVEKKLDEFVARVEEKFSDLKDSLLPAQRVCSPDVDKAVKDAVSAINNRDHVILYGLPETGSTIKDFETVKDIFDSLGVNDVKAVDVFRLGKVQSDVGVSQSKPRLLKSHSSDIDGVLQRAYNSGIEKIIITGGSLTDSREALQLASADERLYITVGCHPTRSQEFEQLQPGSSGDGYFQELLSMITSNPGKVVAIGECELDCDRLQFCPKEVQLKYFEKQLLLAEKTGLPLFLHCRNSFRDFIDVMTRNRAAFNGGVIHSFDGTLEEARDAVNFGLYIGLNVCSLKSAQNLDVVKSIPIESILLETDAPCSNYPAILEQLWCPICLMIMSQPLELGAAM
eukprot:Em0017g823a